MAYHLLLLSLLMVFGFVLTTQLLTLKRRLR